MSSLVRPTRPRYHNGPAGSLMIAASSVLRAFSATANRGIDVGDGPRRIGRADAAVDEQRAVDQRHRRLRHQPAADPPGGGPGRVMLELPQRHRRQPRLPHRVAGQLWVALERRLLQCGAVQRIGAVAQRRRVAVRIGGEVGGRDIA